MASVPEMPQKRRFPNIKFTRNKAEVPLNILLTNGRFPVSIDIARQLHSIGHHVFVVDAMHYHVCKFSIAVKKSYLVTAPHIDSAAFVDGVKNAVRDSCIDLILPLHEEVFYLADCNDPEIIDKLFAHPFRVLMRLHNKWEFSRLLSRIGLDAPKARLCKSMDDVQNLDLSIDMALKPVFGRAASNVFHLKPGNPLPEEVGVSDNDPYIAQEWVHGRNLCSYSVVRSGKIHAHCVYGVSETIDGSSCVWFKAIDHPGIYEYTEKLAAALQTSGQIALDFIETDTRLVAIECNPRATSGIHLFSGKSQLARVLTDPEHPYKPATIGRARQIMPGMLMWEHKQATTKQYLTHMKRLMATRDVTFAWGDVMPSLMQPFLMTSYYAICRERNMKLPQMFQWDLLWEPDEKKLKTLDKLFAEKEEGVAGDTGSQ